MFGLPLLLFSFIIYMLCTAEEGGDDQEFNEDDEDDEVDENIHKEESLDADNTEITDKGGLKPKTE